MKKHYKVGVITNYSNINYGSLFQAVALQKIIFDFGYQALHICFERTPMQRKWYRKYLRIMYNRLFGYLTDPSVYLEIKFKQFRKRHIKESEKVKYGKLNEIKNKYDVFVCGSDQIWSPNQYDPAYFFFFF